MLKRSVVTSADTVRTGLQSIIGETGVDDRADVCDHHARLPSSELIAEAARP